MLYPDYFNLVSEALKESPPYTEKEIEAVRYFTKGKLRGSNRKKIEITSDKVKTSEYTYPAHEVIFMALADAVEAGEKIGKLDNFHFIHGKQEDIDKMVRLWELKTKLEEAGGIEEVIFDVLARLEAVEKKLENLK